MIASPELIAALDADGQSFMMARSAPRENAATDGTIVFEWRLIRVGRRGVAALYVVADRETARSRPSTNGTPPRTSRHCRNTSAASRTLRRGLRRCGPAATRLLLGHPLNDTLRGQR